MVRSPCLWESFLEENQVFLQKVWSYGEFFGSVVLFTLLDRFFFYFWCPGTTKVAILYESGIEIKKITKSTSELAWDDFWSHFSSLLLDFSSMWEALFLNLSLLVNVKKYATFRHRKKTGKGTRYHHAGKVGILWYLEPGPPLYIYIYIWFPHILR